MMVALDCGRLGFTGWMNFEAQYGVSSTATSSESSSAKVKGQGKWCTNSPMGPVMVNMKGKKASPMARVATSSGSK